MLDGIVPACHAHAQACVWSILGLGHLYYTQHGDWRCYTRHSLNWWTRPSVFLKNDWYFKFTTFCGSLHFYIRLHKLPLYCHLYLHHSQKQTQKSTRQLYVKRGAPTIYSIILYSSQIGAVCTTTIITSIYQHLLRYLPILRLKTKGKTPYRNAWVKTAGRRVRHPCHLQTNSKQLNWPLVLITNKEQ